jgi:hypothetical protein
VDDLILVFMGVVCLGAVVALVGWIAGRRAATRDDTTIDLTHVDLSSHGSDGSPEAAARRLIGSIDDALDSVNPPNDTTAVLCMISTVNGRLEGPTLYVAPAGPDMVHRDRPWERMVLPGMERLTKVAESEPAEVAERLHGLVRGWVQNLYREVSSVEPTESDDVLRGLDRVGATVRSNFTTGMGMSEMVGGTRLVACLVLVAPERRLAERDVTVVLETVLAAQWIDSLGAVKLWRQEPTQDMIAIKTVSSLLLA